jgi:hypothetical protein
MELERKALYNLLRMNWLNDPNSDVEPWHVEDYRNLGTHTLFQYINAWDIHLDQQRFFSLADSADSPEMLSEMLMEDLSLEPHEQDQIFLLIFELWRRLLPERVSLSIFCDELDHQIYLYDKDDLAGAEAIQDTLANLQMIMDDNSDEGVKPTEIFEKISYSCANDLESFLYDYIAEQMDTDNIPYARELIEGLAPYMKGSKWFDLLQIRLLEISDTEIAHDNLKKMVQKVVKENDLPFNLEVLSFIVQAGGKGEFNKMVRHTLPLLKKEEDFRDLLEICTDYYNCIDEDKKERQVQELLENRNKDSSNEPLNPHDEDLSKLLKIIR